MKSLLLIAILIFTNSLCFSTTVLLKAPQFPNQEIYLKQTTTITKVPRHRETVSQNELFWFIKSTRKVKAYIDTQVVLDKSFLYNKAGTRFSGSATELLFYNNDSSSFVIKGTGFIKNGVKSGVWRYTNSDSSYYLNLNHTLDSACCAKIYCADSSSTSCYYRLFECEDLNGFYCYSGNAKTKQYAKMYLTGKIVYSADKEKVIETLSITNGDTIKQIISGIDINYCMACEHKSRLRDDYLNYSNFPFSFESQSLSLGFSIWQSKDSIAFTCEAYQVNMTKSKLSTVSYFSNNTNYLIKYDPKSESIVQITTTQEAEIKNYYSNKPNAMLVRYLENGDLEAFNLKDIKVSEINEIKEQLIALQLRLDDSNKQYPFYEGGIIPMR